MGDWLTLSQVARFWNVTEDEARQALLDRRKRPPRPSGQIYLEQDFLEAVARDLAAKAQQRT